MGCKSIKRMHLHPLLQQQRDKGGMPILTSRTERIMPVQIRVSFLGLIGKKRKSSAGSMMKQRSANVQMTIACGMIHGRPPVPDLIWSVDPCFSFQQQLDHRRMTIVRCNVQDRDQQSLGAELFLRELTELGLQSACEVRFAVGLVLEQQFNNGP